MEQSYSNLKKKMMVKRHAMFSEQSLHVAPKCLLCHIFYFSNARAVYFLRFRLVTPPFYILHSDFICDLLYLSCFEGEKAFFLFLGPSYRNINKERNRDKTEIFCVIFVLQLYAKEMLLYSSMIQKLMYRIETCNSYLKNNTCSSDRS